MEPGWTNTTASAVTFNLTDHVVVDFFNNYTAFTNVTSLYSISGRVFNDTDNSGNYSLGDGLINNQLVVLNDKDGFPIDFSYSDSSGIYSFANLKSGAYSLRIQVPSGYTNTTPYFVPVAITNSSLKVDFGYRGLSTPITYSVDGYVWYDSKNYGVWDAGETGLGSWWVYIYSGSYTPYFGQYSPAPIPFNSTSTNGSGYYYFTGLGNSTYTVIARLLYNYDNTTPRQVTFTISGAPHVNASFGEDLLKPAPNKFYSVSGYKYNDSDNSASYTAGESKLNGWTIWYNDNEGYPIRSANTNSSGIFIYSSLPDGVYTIYEQNQTGWVNTTLSVMNVTINKASNNTLSFGNRLLALPTTYLISGYVFNDTNRNNAFDDGNATMTDAWTIFLYNGAFSPYSFPSRITTTASGQYTFSGLNPGTYTVVEVLKANYTSLWARFVSVTLTSASMTNQSFFNKWVGPQPTYLVYGYKYNDTDLDKFWNTTISDEAALNGWQISIYDSFGWPVANTTTSSGYYSFLVPNGDYTVTENLASQSGWTYSTPYQVNITIASAPVRVDFGNYMIGNAPAYSMYGWVFNDTNKNAVQDAGEAGLSGWVVYLYNKTGPTTYTRIAHKYTDSNGFYIFPNYPLGDYRLYSYRYSSLYSNTSNYYTYPTLSTADWVQNFSWYYNYTPVVTPTISGRVYNNVPANGLANWTVIVTNGTYINSKLTDSTGNYSFALSNGTYTVQAVVMSGYYNTTPSILSVTLAGAGQIVDFGMNLSAALPRYTITGLKFNDLDMNGSQSAGELPIAGWGFILYNSTDLFTAFTNSSGIWTFNGLLAGTYTVNETYRGGWVASTPTSVTVNLTSNGTFLKFGNYLNYSAGMNFSISGYVLTNGTGIPLSGWLLTLSDYQGIIIDSQLTNAMGLYNFSSLAGGKYTVQSWYDSGAGWKNVTATKVTLDITNSSVTGLNFLYLYDRYNVTGYVYFDVDKNGAYLNTIDIPLAGWQVTLRNALGDTLVATTDSSGRYVFSAQPPGIYTLSEVIPLGWNATSSSSVVLNITNSDQSVNFGNKRWFYGQFLTYDRMMWSADANGYLQNNISAISGTSWVVTIGTTAANQNQWDNLSYIKGYLANSNPATALDQDYSNSSGALAGQGGVLGANLLALRFNIDYDNADFGLFNFGPTETLLQDLRIFNYSAAANGKTIGQIFTEANNFIATGSGSMTAADYSNLIARINSAFAGTDYSDATYFLY